MKAAALHNVQNLAIGVIVAHHRSSPIFEVESDFGASAQKSDEQPINAVVQVDMHNIELRSSNNDEDQPEEEDEVLVMKKVDKSTQFKQFASDESDDNQDVSIEEHKVCIYQLHFSKKCIVFSLKVYLLKELSTFARSPTVSSLRSLASMKPAMKRTKMTKKIFPDPKTL